MSSWLEELASQGRLDSSGVFTMALDERLDLADVPPLVLAGAVEAGSSFFRVHGPQNLRLSWEGELGPCGRAAVEVLAREGVDARVLPGCLELPPAFWDYLGPLSRRSRHAPLDLVWQNRLVCRAWQGIGIRPSSRPSLTLVDRGLDFPLPVALPGLEVVATVGPLPGSPWPRALVWGEQLLGILEGLEKAVSAAVQPPGCRAPLAAVRRG